MNYEYFLTEKVFPIVKGKNVLELGALNNRITDCLKKAGAYYVETVDPVGLVKPIFKGTANDYYKQFSPEDGRYRDIDVVVVMGLLYHLHSPWHLLELIINYSQPDTLIIETSNGVTLDKGIKVPEGGYKTIGIEQFSTLGNAWPDKDIEHPISIHTSVTREDYIKGIETTPMKLDKYWNYPDMEDFSYNFEGFSKSKHDMWLGVFKWKD